MSADLVNALSDIAGRMISLASEDAQLRSQLRRLAQVVLEATGTPEQDALTLSPAESQQATAVEAALSAASDGVEIRAPEAVAPFQGELPSEPPMVLPELTLGRSPPPIEAAAPSHPAHWIVATDADLALIEARCRLKAEGSRWAATRRRLIADGVTFSTEIEPMDRNIITRAKEIENCFLWMCNPRGPSPSDLKLYENVAGCFEAVAEIVAVLKQIQEEPEWYERQFEHSLDLLAEAQSALRVAIAKIDGPSDIDQVTVFNWLKATASKNQIFIRRYMRADDPANPTQWGELSSRIEAVDSGMQETRRRAKHRRRLMGKVRHKLALIAEQPDAADEHWRILAATVDELTSDGLPPSNTELRELLVPAIDGLPDLADLPKGFQLVLREVDRYMATCPPPETTSTAQRTPEVLEVARLLGGRSMVVIGGDRRPGSYQALKEAFCLRNVFWIETREHQSIDGFEAYIARPDVAVVVLAIRWSSHSFGEVRDFCERYGKPLVRLPGGYNPSQVAAQIMAQCSDRLRGSIER
jgi:hypothetical protein